MREKYIGYYEKYIKIFGGFIMNNTAIEYVLRAYRIIKKEITNASTFEIDERYFQLRRDLQICEEYLRNNNEQLAEYI
jgi:hypothetical protein